MATLRTNHKRRKRNLLIDLQPCAHITLEDYADGSFCQRCRSWFESVFWKRKYEAIERDDWDDGESDGECFYCGGEGWIDGYEDDPLWYAPGEMDRCSSCGGSGAAKDMTIW
jgi:hypothetical protein